jgi:site-specific DNA-methyltransferase (adenine-specific)
MRSEGKKEILLGDCLELMRDIPNGSIDMILADLPYGTTACKWDSIIPLEPLWSEYKRIIKDNGAIVLTASQPFTTKLISSNYEMFKYEWIWIKKKSNSGFAHAKNKPLKKHESILVFSLAPMGHFNLLGDKRMLYNPQGLIEINKKRNNNTFQDASFGKRPSSRNTLQMFENYPNNLLYYDVEQKGKYIHPTQKPIELFEYLIKTYTNEGDLVLDNTAGSGTTAIACLNTNRQFIVMEKEQKYYDIILKRVGDFNKKFEPQTLFGNEM